MYVQYAHPIFLGVPLPLPGLSVKGLEANTMNQTCQSLQHTDMTLHYELMPHWKSPNAFDSSKKYLLALHRASMLQK